MDPLSVATSVTGLLQIGAKVIGLLSTTIDAPSTARNVLAEVKSLHAIFGQLEDFIVHFTEQSMARKSRIYVEDLVATLTGCVCTFSELDKELKGLKTDHSDDPKSKFGIWDRGKWAAKDQDIAKILRNLQMHKTSLSLLLGIYTCSSTQQVQRDMAELKRFMTAIMEANPSLEARMVDASSGDDDVSSVRSRTSILSTISERCFRHFSTEHEQTPVENGVNKQAAGNSAIGSLRSIRTSDSRSSQLSGLSMAQIPNLSIICLPVNISELNNGDMYSRSGRETGGRVAGEGLIVGQLQRLRKGSINLTTSVRYHMTPYSSRTSLLHAAAGRGNTIAVMSLVQSLGLSIEAIDTTAGRTPLHFAVINGHTDTAKHLLDQGADIEAEQAEASRRPLHLAAWGGHTATVQLLLDWNADIEAKELHGFTALQFAAQMGHTATVQLLLDRNAGIEAIDNDSWTSLHHAVRNGHTATVQLLLDRNADIKATRFGGATVLIVAAHYGSTNTVRLLLDRNADIEAKNDKSYTALLAAAGDGHTATVQLLLDRNADIKAKELHGCTALQLAAQMGHTATVQLLLDRNDDIKATTKDDLTPLHLAARNFDPDTVQLLLDRNADVQATTKDNRTPLHEAAAYGRYKTLRLLLDRNADIEAKTSRGLTALLIAAEGGRIYAVRVLLIWNADIKATDRDGWTALHLAVQSGHTSIVDELLRRNPNIKAKTSLGLTALNIATQKRYSDIVKRLLKAIAAMEE